MDGLLRVRVRRNEIAFTGFFLCRRFSLHSCTTALSPRTPLSLPEIGFPLPRPFTAPSPFPLKKLPKHETPPSGQRQHGGKNVQRAKKPSQNDLHLHLCNSFFHFFLLFSGKERVVCVGGRGGEEGDEREGKKTAGISPTLLKR